MCPYKGIGISLFLGAEYLEESCVLLRVDADGVWYLNSEWPAKLFCSFGSDPDDTRDGGELVGVSEWTDCRYSVL